MVELPDEGNRAVATMAHMARCSETREGALVGPEPSEQHDLGTDRLVIDVALARLAFDPGS